MEKRIEMYYVHMLIAYSDYNHVLQNVLIKNAPKAKKS